MEARQLARVEERAEKKRLDEYWKKVVQEGWDDKLHATIKSGVPRPPGAYKGVYVESVPQICIINQRMRAWKQRMRKAGRNPNVSNEVVLPLQSIPQVQLYFSISGSS